MWLEHKECAEQSCKLSLEEGRLRHIVEALEQQAKEFKQGLDNHLSFWNRETMGFEEKKTQKWRKHLETLSLIQRRCIERLKQDSDNGNDEEEVDAEVLKRMSKI